MNIVFDCRYTRLNRHDGISRYTRGLVTALAELHPVTMLISDQQTTGNAAGSAVDHGNRRDEPSRALDRADGRTGRTRTSCSRRCR